MVHVIKSHGIMWLSHLMTKSVYSACYVDWRSLVDTIQGSGKGTDNKDLEFSCKLTI